VAKLSQSENACPTGDARIVRLGDGVASARIAIVASGLGGEAIPEPTSRIGAGVLLEAEAASSFYARGTIYMATGRGGYVGLVRVEDQQLDIAAALDPKFVKSAGGVGPAAETILHEVGWPVPPNLAEQPWRGTVALTRHKARLGGDRFFVVGDAAGYVEPFTGEGMGWAATSAAALAPLASKAIRQWNDQYVPEWESIYRRVVSNRQRVCRLASRVLRSPFLTHLAVGALSIVPVLSQPVVSALNRPSSLPHAANA
jgi:2-polyprenyl-6-methoxyphenol hydroxylase-like FAD-dependent oxidoreductase